MFVVRREGDGQDLFRWNIYRRKTPLGVRLTEGGFTSFHAASGRIEGIAELVQSILEEEKNGMANDGQVTVTSDTD